MKEVCKNGKDPLNGFIYPSYVEDIMGPILFDYGYGPFRWVCLSGKEEDLDLTDKVAMETIDKIDVSKTWIIINGSKMQRKIIWLLEQRREFFTKMQ